VSKLAIRGGTPCIPEKFTPILRGDQVRIGPEELAAATSSLAGSHLGECDPIARFERNWADYIGTKYCVAMNSGTSALTSALRCVGLERGEEVITSSFTFIASATCILYQNGVPVFADIDPRTYNLSPADVERRITPRTRAILPVHISGLPADMDEINAIARKHHLAVIEDACQAHGALYNGRKAGKLADIGCFSLQRSKNLTGGQDGGLLNTDNDDYAALAGAMREFGEYRMPKARREYNSKFLGQMFRIDSVRAAIADCRLAWLDSANRTRQAMCELMTRELSDIPGVVPPHVPKDRTHVYYFYIVRFDPAAAGYGDLPPGEFRDKVSAALDAEGVHLGMWQTRPVHRQDVIEARVGYGKGCPWTCPHAGKVEYRDEDLPNVNRFFENYTCLWSFYHHDEPSAVKAISEAFHKVLGNLGELF
jgi:dTDP-4-amino-4,6-dideoxygalactose transaminase